MARTNLVTGASGFLGTHLVHALLARGEKVRGFDINISRVPREAEAIEGSVNDGDAVAAAIEGVETVFHAAANPFLWARDRLVFDAVNVAGTNTVLEAAAAAGVGRVVHVSSATTLVGHATPRARQSVDETTELSQDDMLGPYPLSKRRGELAALQAARQGLDVVIVLPTQPLGPGDHNLTAPTRMVMDLINGKIPATLDCLLNPVDVRDVADGAILARDKGASATRYLLGGENIEMGEFLGMLARLSGRRMPRRTVPYGLALSAAMVSETISDWISGKPPKAPLTGVRLAGRKVAFDSSRARARLGFRPRPLQDTVRDTIDWLNHSAAGGTG